MHIAPLRLSLLAALVILSAACGNADPTNGPGAPAGETASEGTPASDAGDTAPSDLANESGSDPVAANAPDPTDPCRLLEPAEVEAVLGAPLAGAPFRGGNPNGDSAGLPDDTGYWCWYETAGRRNLALTFDAEHGGDIVAGVGGWLGKAEGAAEGLIKLQDGTELVGDWDEVKMSGCCGFMALQGDSLVEVDFGGSLASAEQVGELVNKALGRLAAPLAVDGRAGIPAAQQRVDARYSNEDQCALWTPADIARLLGPLQGDMRSGDDCTITWQGKNGRSQMAVVVTEPRNGYRTFRRENATFAGMAARISAEGAEEDVGLREAQGMEGPWEAAEDGPIQFNAVRADASISVRHSGMSDDELRALLGHAFDRIAQGSAP
ncbi:MAG: hypothetical protein KA196_06940 [Arenimonas sp.]|nr:hypothetical protein [Arenimonas sp.]